MTCLSGLREVKRLVQGLLCPPKSQPSWLDAPKVFTTPSPVIPLFRAPLFRYDSIFSKEKFLEVRNVQFSDSRRVGVGRRRAWEPGEGFLF